MYYYYYYYYYFIIKFFKNQHFLCMHCEYLKDTILSGYKIGRFEDPTHVWQVLIVAILCHIRV